MAVRQAARRPPPALRHVITHRVAFSAVALTALITAVFTAATVSFFGAVTAIAARSELSGNPGSAIVVTASVTRDSVRQASRLVAGLIRGPRPGLHAAIDVSLQSAILNLPRRKAAAVQLQTQLISLPGLAGHVDLVSGSCQGAAGYPLAACVPQDAARVLGLATGDRLTLHDIVTGAPVRVRITGIFRLVHPASEYWMLDPLRTATARPAGGFVAAGPLVISQAEAASGHLTVRSATWLGIPDLARLGTSGLAATGNQLAARITALPNSAALPDAVVTTGLPDELIALATALVVARTQLLAGMLTLLVIAVATLTLAVRLLAQRREAEAALLAARGASRIQLARRGLIDAVIVAVPAAIAAPWLGVLIARILIRSSPLAGAGLRLTPVVTGTVWLATVAVAAGCVAVIALPWLRRPPSPLRRRASQGRQRRIAAAVYARADLAVVAVATAASWQLIHSAGPVSTGLDGTLSADPILVVAPVLALVAGALLTLRALPLAARLADRTAARGRGLTLPVAAWQISRRALRQTGPTLVAVLAVAAAVMTVSQRESWQRSVQAQASFDVGADTRVMMPPAAPLGLGQVGRITGAPGVTASTPAIRAPFSLPGGAVGTLLALNARAAAMIIPAQAAGPSPALLSRLAASAPRTGVQVPGRPAAVRLTARLSRGTIGQPSLFIQFSDAAGIGYLLPAGGLPADGRPHTLTVAVAASGHADYPLRITGFSLQFTPPRIAVPADTLTLSAGQALAGGDAASGRAFDLAPPGRPLLFVSNGNPGGGSPSLVRAAAGHRSGVVMVFNSGQAGSPAIPVGVSLSDSYPGVGRPLPAVVSRSLLAATGLRIGDHMQASIDGTSVPITPVAAVRNLPTIGGGGPSLLVDQGALQAALQAAGAPPVGVTEWWLRTTSQPSFAGLPAGRSIASLAAMARALLADPFSQASQQALLAIAIAALLLAVIGLLASVATAAERARDLALLDALGMPPRQVARLLGIEQALTVGITSGIGLLFGAALSEVIIPAVALTSHAARPVPPIVVQVPWLLAAVVALAVAAVPTLAVTLAVPRGGSGAARIRLEDES